MSDLVFQSVRKTFGRTVALQGLDLAVKPGELVSLLGPSGCGKTTALRIAAGFDSADSGAVLVGGADISNKPAHKRNMGMVFQSYSLFPNLSVADNVGYGLRARKVGRTASRERVAAMLELVQLGDQAAKYPHQLSGGQQQRVALARALAIEPSVLLLDEPLSALDAKVRTSLRDEIRRIQSEVGITTLFVTHDQEEALAISDRVAVMSQGQLEQFAPPTEIYRAPATAFVARFIGTMNEIPGMANGNGTVTLGSTTVPAAAASGITGTVKLLVRPEATSIAGEEGPLNGTVKSLTFEGASTNIRVALADPAVDVDVLIVGVGAVEVRPGDPVNVSFDPATAVIERPTTP